MNNLLIEIAKRLVCKAIKVNTEEYNVEISYKFIGNAGAITVCIFREQSFVESFYFYDDNPHNQGHLSQFRYILRAINKGSKKWKS